MTHGKSVRLESARFIVCVNGDRTCVAGADGYAVLGVSVVHLSSDAMRSHPDGKWRQQYARVTAGGLQGDSQLRWMHDALFVGDVLSITLRDDGVIDTPLYEVDVQDVHHYEEVVLKAEREASEAHRKRFEEIGGIAPHRFRIAINGEHLCTAGVETGVTSIDIAWVRRDPMEKPPEAIDCTQEEWEDGYPEVSVGGLESGKEFLQWRCVPITPGDEVTIEPLGPGEWEAPLSRRPADELRRAWEERNDSRS